MALFCPTAMRYRLTDLHIEDLQSMGVTTLLLDVDNTLSTHHSQTPIEGLEAWLSGMKQAGVGLFIVSNSKARRVKPFAEKLDLPFFSLCKKPLPFQLNKAVKTLGVSKKQVMLCGDQLFTDMLGGHLAGIQTLLVSPILEESGWSFKVCRKLEKPLIRKYKKKLGVTENA